MSEKALQVSVLRKLLRRWSKSPRLAPQVKELKALIKSLHIYIE